MSNHQDEIKLILEKLNKLEKQKLLFESCGKPHKKKSLKEKINTLYEEADDIASMLSQKHGYDKDEIKSLIREMIVSYEKIMENIRPINFQMIEKNPELKRKIRDAIENYYTLHEFNPRIPAEEQARMAAEDNDLDPEFFIKYLKHKGVL